MKLEKTLLCEEFVRVDAKMYPVNYNRQLAVSHTISSFNKENKMYYAAQVVLAHYNKDDAKAFYELDVKEAVDLSYEHSLGDAYRIEPTGDIFAINLN